MKISHIQTPALGIALLALGSAAFAQAGANGHQTVIYGGQSLDQIGAHVSDWGGGVASEHNGDAFTTAGHAVHIETAGLYQGGEITFDNPVSLGNLKADPTRYLQLIFSADKSTKYNSSIPSQNNPYATMNQGGYQGQRDANTDYHYKLPAGSFKIAQFGQTGGPPPGAPMPPGGYGGGPGIPYMPGMPMTPGMPPGMRPNPNIPGTGMEDTSGLPNLPIKQVHLILIFADGSQAEMLRPISLSEGDDITWLRAGVPLSSIPINSSSESQSMLKKILIGTDTPAILNVGEIRLVNDVTPITADAGKSQTVPTGSSVSFLGTGEGGASALKYEWNFDNDTPFFAEADGVKASHTFSKAGDYTVTLRVSDVDGIKQPATSTVVIHVTDQGPVGSPGQNGIPPGYGGPGPSPGQYVIPPGYRGPGG
jgi:hypothetical protein